MRSAAIVIDRNPPRVNVIDGKTGKLIMSAELRTYTLAKKSALAKKDQLLKGGEAAEVVVIDEDSGEELGTWRFLKGKIVKAKQNPSSSLF